MQQYRCAICGSVYDPSQGDPNADVPPGQAFDSLPESWSCPDCGAGKADFEPLD